MPLDSMASPMTIGADVFRPLPRPAERPRLLPGGPVAIAGSTPALRLSGVAAGLGGDHAGRQGRPAGLPRMGRPSVPESALPAARLTAVAVAITVVLWAVGSVWFERLRLVTLAPPTQAGVETAAALARLFGALVLLLFPFSEERMWRRLRWVAGGLLTTGLGSLIFGSGQLLLPRPLAVNTIIYAATAVATVAGILFVVGLVPAEPPRFAFRPLPIALVAGGIVALAAIAEAGWLPPLVADHNLAAVVSARQFPRPGLTQWHWVFGAVPLGLTAAAAFGMEQRRPRDGRGAWLVIAMILAAGAQLHHLLWPSAYGAVVTSANVLRLAFAAVVALGAVLELRRIAAAHGALLAAEREQARRLAEIASLRADFSRMVAHELGSPIAAIRGAVDMMATGELRPEQEAHAITLIRGEADALTTLVADVRDMASVERDGFAVRPRPVHLDDLLLDAAAMNQTLPGHHPLLTTIAAIGRVRADPERIEQVLRNLLSNAAKYTPAGAPIELRALPTGDRVRIEVVDHGPGIDAADLDRVFEKFGRSRHRHAGDIPGVGLGLYLSRRIVEAHGGELTVTPTPGGGATFGFELALVQDLVDDPVPPVTP